MLPSFVKRGLTESASEAGEEVLFAVTGFGLRGARQRFERRGRESKVVGELGRKGEMEVVDVMVVGGQEVRGKPEGSISHGGCWVG